jgi:hypothetical protein
MWASNLTFEVEEPIPPAEAALATYAERANETGKRRWIAGE